MVVESTAHQFPSTLWPASFSPTLIYIAWAFVSNFEDENASCKIDSYPGLFNLDSPMSIIIGSGKI